MYKLIFIDLDGTLLNDAKEISEENIKWLNRAYKEKGITTIISTGRQYGFVEDLYNKYNCSFGDYVIASNGAIIKNVKTGDYINKDILNIEEIKVLNRICQEEGLDFIIIYDEKNAYMERKDGNTSKNKIQKDKIYVDNIIELLENNKDIEINIVIIGAEKNEFNNAIKRVEKNSLWDYSPISEYRNKNKDVDIREYYFDVMRKGCNKKNAVKKVMDKFGVNHDEIIVIGDGGNDLPMFDYAKLKIAMENGSEALKQKADYITDTNNNDGVAKAIKKFIFEE